MCEARPPRPRAIRITDPDYPRALLDLKDAPRVLHVQGDVTAPLGRAVALVGSRAASPYGRAMADRLARDLVALGCTVVSGLARGIDAAAHEGALAAGGATIGVLPSALARITPESHVGLAARMLERGALVSEIAEGGPFGRGAFVKRNRIIAALAGATVIVEAGLGSGALRTAEAASALGRPVLAVPGDVDRPSSLGTLQLLRSGALPCGDAGDVLAELRRVHPEVVAPAPIDRLLAALHPVAAPLESIAHAADVAVPQAQALLLRLEWSGVAQHEAGGRWRRAKP